MAVEIKRNRLEGYELRLGDESSSEQERIIVTGLSPGTDLVWRAATLGGIPQRGELHPYIPGAMVKSVVGRPINQTDAELLVTYETIAVDAASSGGQANPWVIQTRTSLVQIMTSVDSSGQPILVTYAETPAADAATKTATVPKLVPTQTLTASKILRGRPPDAWYDAVGTVNKRPWQRKKGGTVMFMGIDDSTRNEGRDYAVTLSWMVKKEGWREEALFRDAFGNLAVLSAEDAREFQSGRYRPARLNGATLVCLYKEEDFTSLFGI